MRFEHVAEADLNLLVPVYALLEERQVTQAALRCGLSQPAMSRAFERLRSTFGDELLVRADGKFERTVRAERLLAELRDLLPRLVTFCAQAIRSSRRQAATLFELLPSSMRPRCCCRNYSRSYRRRTTDAGRRRALERRRIRER